MSNQESAIKILTEATIVASGHILRDKGHTKFDYDRLAEAIKMTVKENLDNILVEWEEAVDSFLGEEWLRKMLNAQAWELALKAVEVYNV